MRGSIFIAALLFSSLAFADDKDPRPDMHVMAQEITALQKYLLSESDFNASSNEAAIKKSIANINSVRENCPACRQSRCTGRSRDGISTSAGSNAVSPDTHHAGGARRFQRFVSG